MKTIDNGFGNLFRSKLQKIENDRLLTVEGKKAARLAAFAEAEKAKDKNLNDLEQLFAQIKEDRQIILDEPVPQKPIPMLAMPKNSEHLLDAELLQFRISAQTVGIMAEKRAAARIIAAAAVAESGNALMDAVDFMMNTDQFGRGGFILAIPALLAHANTREDTIEKLAMRQWISEQSSKIFKAEITPQLTSFMENRAEKLKDLDIEEAPLITAFASATGIWTDIQGIVAFDIGKQDSEGF